MKRIFVFLVMGIFIGSLLFGCMPVKSPVVGVLFTDVKANDIATSNVVSKKVGTAKCISVLALVAVGDCSIESAMKNGGITKIHHVDYTTKNFLGIYAEYNVEVYGE
ncbi:MAG: TRL-like family protein [Proteobacteria bacterium]|nr:TRL-like family protein [Pseudomonadota bacterium]